MAAATHMAPTGLWQFLGNSKEHPFQPFAAQAEILSLVKVPHPGIQRDGTPYPRIWGINCGRRFGKTTVGHVLLWQALVTPPDFFGPPTVRMTADTEEHAQKVWRKFVWTFQNTPLNTLVDKYDKEHELVTFKTGATAQMLSANNPQALSGDGVTFWLVDEAQFLSDASWENLFPSISERSGVIVMLGVSEGEGPFREICFKGTTKDDKGRPVYPEFKRLSYPTAANPYVPRSMIEFAQRTLPPHKFRQLYMAQWVSDVGQILRNIEAGITEDPILEAPEGYGYVRPFHHGHDYYGGLDLARLQDYTVYSIWDRQGHLVAWDQFNLVGWEAQKHRAAMLSRIYGHPPTVVDTTGIGDPIFDDLARLGMNVQPYAINSNAAKRILVDELSIRVGATQLHYPRIQALLEQFQRYEAKRSPTGTQIVYGAPSGAHDDWVMSSALAMQIMPRPYTPGYTLDDGMVDAVQRRQSASEFI